MVPPERGFKREANAPVVPLSTVQKVVRYAEKDDLLLYITATFGIVMPALMYFFYKTVHTRFHNYNSKRKAAKRKEQREKLKTRSVGIFYVNSPTKRISYDLAEQLDQFDPVVGNLTGVEIVRKLKASSKTVFIFIVATNEDGRIPETLSCFLDWLDEIRYEHRQKTFMKGASFAIFGIGKAACLNDSDPNNTTTLLSARLKSLQGNQLSEPTFVIEGDSRATERSTMMFMNRITKTTATRTQTAQSEMRGKQGNLEKPPKEKQEETN